MTTLQHLIGQLRFSGILKSPSIIRAFKEIKRADFVLAQDRKQAYENYPLYIAPHQTISQPTTVALMLELLAPRPGNTVLDIGSGSGWTTALLAYLVGNTGYVTGIEIVPGLVTMGQKNLEKYSLRNASIVQAKKKLGIPGRTFHRILVSAETPIFPKELLDQLKPKGKLVIPVAGSIMLYKKDPRGDIHSTEFPGFTFVPLKIEKT